MGTRVCTYRKRNSNRPASHSALSTNLLLNDGLYSHFLLGPQAVDAILVLLWVSQNCLIPTIHHGHGPPNYPHLLRDNGG